MARTERRVELKKKRKKRPEGSSNGSAREPLHVELLRSAGVVDVGGDGPFAAASLPHQKQRQQSREGPAAGTGAGKGRTSGFLLAAAAAPEEASDTASSTSETELEDAADLSQVAAAGAEAVAAAGGAKRRVQQKKGGGEGLLVPAALSKRILRLAEHQQRAADFSDLEEDGEGEAAEDVLYGLEDDELSFTRRSSTIPEDKVDAEGFVVLDQQAADAAEEEEDELYVQRRQQQQLDTCSNGEQAGAFAAAPSLVDSILKKLKAREPVQQEDSLGLRPSDPGSREAVVPSSSIGIPTSGDSSGSSRLPPKVVEVYTAMAPFLEKYRSGKLPKAFKVLPRLQQWEEVLLLTQPQSWSPHALAAATKVFCSNLSSNAVQRFLCLVLLPALRDDIAEHKKLNYHLYQALKKALFKPAAFFKGIFLPLALEGCSRKEAVIVGSVVAKVSIPVLHGAAALLRLSLVPPSQWLPPVSLLMNVLINKKYSLPAKAVQACVLHFHRFRTHTEKLPVSWHRAFLSFVQRYKLVITESDRSKLHEVLRVHNHELIGPEIRRELLAKNPAAVLEQQALLLEKRQQRLEQQQESSGDATSAAAMEVDS